MVNEDLSSLDVPPKKAFPLLISFLSIAIAFAAQFHI